MSFHPSSRSGSRRSAVATAPCVARLSGGEPSRARRHVASQSISESAMQLSSHPIVQQKLSPSSLHTVSTQLLQDASSGSPVSQRSWAHPQARPQAVVRPATQWVSQLLMQHAGSSAHSSVTHGSQPMRRGAPSSQRSWLHSAGGHTPQSVAHAWQFSLPGSRTPSPQTGGIGGHTPQSMAHESHVSPALHRRSPHSAAPARSTAAGGVAAARRGAAHRAAAGGVAAARRGAAHRAAGRRRPLRPSSLGLWALLVEALLVDAPPPPASPPPVDALLVDAPPRRHRRRPSRRSLALVEALLVEALLVEALLVAPALPVRSAAARGIAASRGRCSSRRLARPLRRRLRRRRQPSRCSSRRLARPLRRCPIRRPPTVPALPAGPAGAGRARRAARRGVVVAAAGDREGSMSGRAGTLCG